VTAPALAPHIDPFRTQASDDEVIARVRAGELDWFVVLMRRHNRRIYRVVRSILREDAEAEDAAQDAWVAAYAHLAEFEGRAAFASWLTRIAIRCAVATAARKRVQSPLSNVHTPEAESEAPLPDQNLDRLKLAHALERAIDRLPASQRVVIMLRDIEHLSTSEAATALGVTEESVRVRLHRARSSLRKHVLAELGHSSDIVFPFAGERCDRIVATVVRKLERHPA
jgi:RNA polymerase sigma-70 factor (ECF subfamily)